MLAAGPYVPLVLIAIAFAIVRFQIKSSKPDFGTTGLYKTAAHAFTFGMFGYAWGAWDVVPLVVGLLLTVVEVVAFLTLKH